MNSFREICLCVTFSSPQLLTLWGHGWRLTRFAARFQGRGLGVVLPTAMVLAVAALVPVAASSAEMTGKPRIIDGDTIVIGDQRIRLHGIDTPEARQTCQRQDGTEYRCGDMATFALAELIEEHWVTCKGDTTDRYGRLIGICVTGPVNLNAEMVRRGWALAYRRYSKDYVVEEDEARAAVRGMWQGRFVEPWEWRRGKR